MALFIRKKKTNRRVFGFLCDKAFSMRVKMLAHLIEVPVYTLCEHLLQLGLAHISAEISGNLENLALVTEELRDHLLNEHLLLHKLGSEEHEQRLVARHAELNAGQAQQVRAVINLVKRFEDKGISHDLVIKAVDQLVGRLERRRKVEQVQREAWDRLIKAFQH